MGEKRKSHSPLITPLLGEDIRHVSGANLHGFAVEKVIRAAPALEPDRFVGGGKGATRFRRFAEDS